MVEVDSDLDLTEMDRVQLHVDSVEAAERFATRLESSYVLGERGQDNVGGEIPGSSKVRLPIQLAVLPRRARDASVRIIASGLAPGGAAPIVTTTSIVSFVPERTLLLRMFLSSACVSVDCEEGKTCIASQGEAICANDSIDRPECVLPDLETGLIEPCEPLVDCVAEPGCCGGACVSCCGASDCPDDGNECTGAVVCERGFCVYPPLAGPCEDDGDPCTKDWCEWDTCGHIPLTSCGGG